MFGIAQRRGFGIDRRGFLSNVGGVENIKSFRIRSHHAVFDAVMHHFDEMPGAIGPAVQIALFGGAVNFFATRRAFYVAAPRRQRREQRIEVLHDIGVAADHHAIAAFQPPNAAAGADVDEMNVPGFELLRPANIVNVIRVAAVDQNVAGFKMRQQIGDDAIHGSGRYHQPDNARLDQFLDEVRGGSGTDGFFLHKFRYGVCRSIVDDTLMAALQQAPHHVSAHPAEADHSELHDSSPL